MEKLVKPIFQVVEEHGYKKIRLYKKSARLPVRNACSSDNNGNNVVRACRLEQHIYLY